MAEKNELSPVQDAVGLDEASDKKSVSVNTGDAAVDINRDWQDKAGFFRWFHPRDGPAERRLILRLDISILAFACAGFWVSRANLQEQSSSADSIRLFTLIGASSPTRTSAGCGRTWASSATSLSRSTPFSSLDTPRRPSRHHFHTFTDNTAPTSSIIPLTLVNTRLPPQIVVPVCMVVWGLGTVLATRATSYSELAAYRFLVGFGEGAFFPTMNYIFGSWYRPDEIARRTGVFYIAGSIGTISNSFIAARISQDLDGVLGRPAWRWMFLISGMVAFPIAIAGVLTFPGTPSHPNRRIFKDGDLAIANARLAAVGRRQIQTLSFSVASLKRFFGRWHFWVLIPWSILFQQGYLSMAQNTYALWIRSNTQYSRSQANQLTSVPAFVGIVAIVLFAWVADRFGPRARLPLFALANLIALIGHTAFVAYDRTTSAYKWYAVAVSNVENAMVPVMYSWANVICAGDAEERAFILGSMLAFAMAFNAWVPILSMPTVEAPRFFKGYLLCLIMQPVSLGMTFLVNYLHKRQLREVKKGDNDEDA